MVTVKDGDVQALINLLKENGIQEIEVKDDKKSIRVQAFANNIQNTETIHQTPSPKAGRKVRCK